MNREMRRLQAKEEERAKKRRQEGPRRRRERTSPSQFLREVRQELKKVAWPTRQETSTFTIAVLVTTSILTVLTFGMDLAFKRGILAILGA